MGIIPRKVEYKMSEENPTVEEVKKEEVVESTTSGVEEIKKVPPIVFFEENQTAEIDIAVISEATTGKILYVLPKDVANQSGIEVTDSDKFFVFTPFRFKFSAPNWEQVSLYRQRSSVNQQGRLDKNMFKTFILINHLKEWDIKDSKGDIVELDFDINGEVTKESMSKINRVPSSVWDAVLAMVDKEFGLSNSTN
jgi:hypothetical protein